jgi:Ca2+-dependent lipid-binding protein
MGTEHKTHVHENAGKTPAWGDSFDINLGSVSDELNFEVRDDEVMTSRVIGVMHVKGSALAINGGVREWFTIYHDDKSAGEIHLETHFKPNEKPILKKKLPRQLIRFLADSVTMANIFFKDDYSFFYLGN